MNRCIPIALVLALLTGCATGSKVARIDALVTAEAMPNPWVETTFSIVSSSSDPSRHELQFRELKAGVAAALTEIGLTEESDSEDAKMIVAFDYGLIDHTKRIEEYITQMMSVPGSSTFLVSRGLRAVDEYRTFVALTAFTGRGSPRGEASALWTVSAVGSSKCGDPRRVVPMLVSSVVPYLGSTTPSPVRVKLKENDPAVVEVRAAIRRAFVLSSP